MTPSWNSSAGWGTPQLTNDRADDLRDCRAECAHQFNVRFTELVCRVCGHHEDVGNQYRRPP